MTPWFSNSYAPIDDPREILCISECGVWNISITPFLMSFMTWHSKLHWLDGRLSLSFQESELLRHPRGRQRALILFRHSIATIWREILLPSSRRINFFVTLTGDSVPSYCLETHRHHPLGNSFFCHPYGRQRSHPTLSLVLWQRKTLNRSTKDFILCVEHEILSSSACNGETSFESSYFSCEDLRSPRIIQEVQHVHNHLVPLRRIKKPAMK